MSNTAKEKEKIINYLKQNPYFSFLVKSIGHVDVEFDVYAKNVEHLYQMLEEVTTNFHRYIKNYKYIYSGEWPKYLRMPEE